MSSTSPYPWRLFFLLWISSLIGVAALVPYALVLSADHLKEIPLPLPVLLALQMVQNAILLGVATGVGLLVSRKVGLGAPVLEAWLYRRENLFSSRIFTVSAIAGAAVGAVTVVLAYFVFQPLIPQLRAAPKKPLNGGKVFWPAFTVGWMKKS